MTDYLTHGIYLGFGLACILITSTVAQEYNGVNYNGELICAMPIVQGPCEAAIPSWGFEGGVCRQFNYGGCDGNYNRFESLAACEAVCIPVDCTAPIVTGPCRGSFRRWGSNNDGVCEEFIYGGCQGNSNNFDSPAECETACPPTPVIDPPAVDCNAPLETGNCRASMRRWGFKDGSCQEFLYGGCGGNTNNFVSQAECEVVCPPETKADCNAPLEAGRCKARKIRWGSNSEGVCVQFTYGGCGGNSNRFGSQEACEAACGSNTNVDTPVCDQELITGPCKALKKSWGFSNGKCRKFNYGGCMGNDNRFSTKKACQKQCDPSSLNRKPKLCKDSAEKGIFCADGKRRWFFNKETKKCTRSAGPVCKGNGKKRFGFSSRRVCEKRCN